MKKRKKKLRKSVEITVSGRRSPGVPIRSVAKRTPTTSPGATGTGKKKRSSGGKDNDKVGGSDGIYTVRIPPETVGAMRAVGSLSFSEAREKALEKAKRRAMRKALGFAKHGDLWWKIWVWSPRYGEKSRLFVGCCPGRSARQAERRAAKIWKGENNLWVEKKLHHAEACDRVGPYDAYQKKCVGTGLEREYMLEPWCPCEYPQIEEAERRAARLQRMWEKVERKREAKAAKKAERLLAMLNRKKPKKKLNMRKVLKDAFTVLDRERKALPQKKAIDSFSGEYRFLSNFYPSPVEYRGKEYPTVEHAFQAAKCKFGKDRKMIRNAPTPGAAKKLGRQVVLRDGWDAERVMVMHALVAQKFIGNPDLAKKLRATGRRELIEGNTWGDKFWGTVDGKGRNELGKILMAVREALPD